MKKTCQAVIEGMNGELHMSPIFEDSEGESSILKSAHGKACGFITEYFRTAPEGTNTKNAAIINRYYEDDGLLTHEEKFYYYEW